MPFGVRNAAPSFQRLMDRVLDGLPFCFVYLDDILIASSSKEQHLKDVAAVLTRLQENGLVINPAKSVFCHSSLEYLGHKVSASGITPLPKNASTLADFPPPTTRHELQRFLGMVNFYRRFLPHIAAILFPLTEALKGGRSVALNWTSECELAFNSAKDALAAAAELSHPVSGAPLSLSTDASSTHVGAALHQVVNGVFQPLAFFSAKLKEPETRYSAFDRELLAIFSALPHFRFTADDECCQQAGSLCHISTGALSPGGLCRDGTRPDDLPVHNRKSFPSLLQELDRAAHVFVRTDKVVPPLEPRYTGPFGVMTRYPNYFVVDFGTKKDEVNVSRLKPAFVSLDEPLAVAPRRGRPRKT